VLKSGQVGLEIVWRCWLPLRQAKRGYRRGVAVSTYVLFSLAPS